MDLSASSGVALPTVSVVIAAFSMKRLEDLRQALESVRSQTTPALEVLVVIDHNEELLVRARNEFPDVTVIKNVNGRGASGARNTGVAQSKGEIVAFLDDDAVAYAGWLEALLPHFSNDRVVGVGGRLEPLWSTRRPQWFPPEFDWTVGGSYTGMPECATPVRNVWSGNMAIRRSIFDAIGGFRDGFGNDGSRWAPEDTDLCIRASSARIEGAWMYEPKAVAGHKVPAEREKQRFFLKRCFQQGRGKAALAALNGVEQSTLIERDYARRVLTSGVSADFARLHVGTCVDCYVLRR